MHAFDNVWDKKQAKTTYTTHYHALQNASSVYFNPHNVCFQDQCIPQVTDYVNTIWMQN